MSRPTLETIAKALIINDQNQALILTIGEHYLRPENSFTPDLPGGIVDLGESELATVIREIREETAIEIDVKAPKLIYAQTKFRASENKSITRLVYLIKLDSTPLVKLSWEHQAYTWVSLSEINSVDLKPFYSEAATYYLKTGFK